MHVHESGSESQQNDPLQVENSARQQESLTSLQYVIALLIEKNEQMRQQLSTRTPRS
jgi:hypothetical protein